MCLMTVTCSSVGQPTLAVWKTQCVFVSLPVCLSVLLCYCPKIPSLTDLCVVMSPLKVCIQRQARELPRHLPSALQHSARRQPLREREVPWRSRFFSKRGWSSLDVHGCCIRWKCLVGCSHCHLSNSWQLPLVFRVLVWCQCTPRQRHQHKYNALW
jgi:hypothetical protein